MKPNAVNSNSLVNTQGCTDSESALHKSIERVAGEILPKKVDTAVNGNNAPNPRNSLLYSTTKFAIEREMKLLVWNQHTIDDLERALADAKATHELIKRNVKSVRTDFERAIEFLGIDVNREEDELLGYGKE